MTEAIIILMNMRGGCATVGNTVHALFRVNGRKRRDDASYADQTRARGSEPTEAAVSK